MAQQVGSVKHVCDPYFLSHAAYFRLRPRFRYRPKSGYTGRRPYPSGLHAHFPGEGFRHADPQPGPGRVTGGRAGRRRNGGESARLGRNTVDTIQLVEEFNRRGVHFRALDLGIDSRTPAGKMIIGVFSSSNQYERENNRKKSLAGIELAKQQDKHLGRPAGRDAEKLSKVAPALKRGLSVSEIVILIDISRASVKRYRQEIAG